MGHPGSPDPKGGFAPGAPLGAGTSSEVRPVVLPDGRPAVLKRYRSHRAWRQARVALQEWGPRTDDRVRIPAVLAIEPDGPLTLLLERLPGVTPTTLDLPLARSLGAALAALHGVPVPDDDPLPLAGAAAARMAGWLTRARGYVEEELLAAVADCFHPEALAGRRRAPCHRDVELANLLVGAGPPGLIDFEHARLDDPLIDVVRTWDGRPLADSPFTATLVGAWGHPAPESALRAHGLLHGVATLCKAEQDGDPLRSQRARHLLIEIMRTNNPP